MVYKMANTVFTASVRSGKPSARRKDWCVMPLSMVVMASVKPKWWTMSDIMCADSSRIAKGLGRRREEAEVGGRDEATRVQGGTESWHGW